MLRLKVKDFGPIIEGDVKLKPFNVFIGPNNSGKSYLAVLAYSIFHSAGVGRLPTFPFLWRLAKVSLGKKREQALNSFKEWFEQHAEEISKGALTVKIAELPEDVRDKLDATTRLFLESASFSEELQRCFSSKIADLVRKEPSVRGFHVFLRQEHPQWQIEFHSSNNKLEEKRTLDILPLSFQFQLPPRRQPVEFTFGVLMGQFHRHLYKGIPDNAWYLPAARSGILQGHKLLASSMLGRFPLVGIEPIEIPRLSGVIADFMRNLLILEKGERKRNKELNEVAKFLTQEVIKGDIDIIEAGKIEYPEIYYKSEIGKFSLHRTSSMVSELAPIVLFLKYVIKPGDFLIIEEPESHLHPEGQRKLVRGLVKLLRAGVKVLITTHSDYFLGELNNFIRLSQTSPNVRKERGYSEDDYLKSDEVGAYLFELDSPKGGSIVKELEVTPEDGIPEEEFIRVAEALGNETAYIGRYISP